jgi:septation ring formation regulator EzrA
VTVLVIAIIAVVVIAVALIVMRRSRPADGVAQFQRQINALSPEARRPVVDKVQQLEPDLPDEPDEPEQRKDADGS